MKWSTYSEKIFADAMFSKKSTLVRARAGSGKSTNLIESTRRMMVRSDETLTVVTFANRSKERLDDDKSLPKYVEVSTLHSLGYSLLRANLDKCELEKNKMRMLL